VSVEVASWRVKRGPTNIDGPPPTDELSREYRFSGPRASDPPAIFKIVCTLQSAGDSVSINRRLRFYLTPFRLTHEAPFVLRLQSTDNAEGGAFDVLASPVAVETDTAIFSKFGGRNDVATCLKAMMSGRDLLFTLADATENLVKLPLPNDQEFRRLYEETCQRLAEVDAASEILRSQNPEKDPAAAPLPSGHLSGEAMTEKWERLRGYRRFFMWVAVLAWVLHVLTVIQLMQGRASTFLFNFLDIVDLSQLISVPGWIIAGVLERKERLKTTHPKLDA
jgi:hypothetical protein